MAAPNVRSLVVQSSSYITPNMLRVTLGGKDIQSIPEKQQGGYVKLVFPDVDGRRTLRTYTIRHQRNDEIDVDFMMHQEGGPASSWAQQAQVGERILVGGPGPAKMINEDADWLLLVGDMTALPAISVNLEQLSGSAKGYAIIEVVSESDIQNIQHPENVVIKWVVNPHPGQDDSALLNEVKHIPWPAGKVAVWAACEFKSMKQLRSFFKVDKSVPKENLYISSYWKLGITEEQHKEVKQQDSVNN